MSISAYETALIPHLDMTLETQRGVMRSFAVEFARFLQHPIENGHSTYSDVQWDGRNTLFRPRFLLSRRNHGARASDFEEIGQKSRRVETTIAPGLQYGVPGGPIQVGGTFVNSKTRYDAAAIYQGSSLAQKLNFNRNTYSADLSVQVTPLTGMLISGSRSKDHFLLTPERDGTSSQAMLSVEFAPQADITGSFGVGVKHASAPDPGLQPFNGVIWIGQLRHVSSLGTQSLLDLRCDTQYSYDVGHSYFVNTQTRFSVTQPVGGGIELFGQFGMFGLKYKGTLRGSERGLATGGGLRYKIRKTDNHRCQRRLDHPEWKRSLERCASCHILAHGTRFMHLERTTPGDDYTK